ncbi:activator of 90 kDa heat shock protein ATPase homolog 1 [Nematostella vectensis]|uniref:activator of 90 kDa heat shock protein ATPase homolog 1 n=1 Tax=Nematostella vectensis TaxID=45351 RepID=UPI00207795F3|nr:activator of 90 kDa heat shock protein ATPase homolog 1 [Nematostella vectensis]
MAKWGEGDPRWIVEERADAKNVNNWHWTEKNASPWSKDKFEELLKGLEIENEQGKCKITNISKVEGEAFANNRKAKLIFLYEWVIQLEWSGTLTESENVLKGKVEIPNLSEENEIHEVDVNVSTNKDTKEGDKLKAIMRTVGVKLIRQRLADYVHQLKTEFIQGMILPSKDATNKPDIPPTQQEQAKEAFKNLAVSPGTDAYKNGPTKPLGVPISTKKLIMKEEFLMSAEDLYSTLTEEQRVSAFTRDSCKVDATRGGSFVLLDGQVSGKFTELIRDEKIVMEWRQKSWPAGHHSTATITLSQKDDRTELKLVQAGVPEASYENTKQGWKQYYWAAIKQTFMCGERYF